jgi:hypothetical protein
MVMETNLESSKSTIKILGAPTPQEVLYVEGLKANLLSMVNYVIMILWYNFQR